MSEVEMGSTKVVELGSEEIGRGRGTMDGEERSDDSENGMMRDAIRKV